MPTPLKESTRGYLSCERKEVLSSPSPLLLCDCRSASPLLLRIGVGKEEPGHSLMCSSLCLPPSVSTPLHLTAA
jgi:hypothetical protein